ncbi:ABC transporter substrate-binding protein [Psychromonas sp.]|uniref:ABC transporter substrate-binding protein n=1 Tax=Psychromonas sp. TaxID=1884585 RepID=UPI00356ACC27
MNNFKLICFILFLLLFIGLIQFQKGRLFTLFEADLSDFSTQVEGEHFPKKLIDKTGIEFILAKPPTRILSATLVTDHILSDLVDPARLVAVSSYVDIPSMSNIVGFYDPSISRTQGEIESMLALQPDLVFVASYSNPETVRYLLRSDISVVRMGEFNSFADIINNIILIARVTDTQAAAEKLINKLNKRLDFVRRQVKDKTPLRVLYYDPSGYSVGGNSLMDETIRLAGGVNVAAGVIGDGENKISEEVAIALQPDVIVMNQWVFNQQNGHPSVTTLLREKSAWADVPAVKNDRIYALPGTWLRGISQHRINGVEALAELLHPDIKTYQESSHVR